jgi:hypothetical protein
MTFPILPANGQASYNLTRSLRFRASASAYLNRTPASAGNRKTWTWSAWVKRGTLGSNQVLFISKPSGTSDATFTDIAFSSSNTLLISGYSVQWRNTTQVFRDPSAWYHIVVAWDTTQATASNRVKVYVNGSQITAFGTTFDPSLNFDGAINQADVHAFCAADGYSYGYFDGYLTEVNFIDGQALTPSSFGSTNALTGVWQPARYGGAYGTNGFYLPFTDNSALTTSSNVGLGRDYSGNGNYWVTNNISITAGVTYDSMTDVPTLTSATASNFAVLNPLKSYYAPTNGNLSMSTGANSTGIDFASIGLGTGVKFYFEATATGTAEQIGIFSSNHALTPTGSKRYWYVESGGLYNDGTLLQSVATFTSGDTIAVAWDGTAQTVTFYKNNTQQGTAISVDTSYSYFFGVGAFNGGWNANFGQRPFTYTPPTGFVALNTFNLPTSTIVKGNTVMDATLYTGNGSTQTITNAAGFKPDLVWAKNRTAAYEGGIYDSVRGTGTLTSLTPSSTRAESGNTTDFNLTSFNSNGFSLGTTSGTNVLNRNGDATVAWQWQAGQGSSSSNTNGTITSTVSVNASAGFSIVSYTGTGSGATVGHGLGVTPSVIICKNRSATGAWHSYFSAISGMQNGYIVLNSTAAFFTPNTTVWNGIQPTSTVFSIGTDSGVNGSGNAQIAYCWTPIAGYSAFGSYTGNGSADGPFIYLGFRPKFVMVKVTSTSSVDTNWNMIDTTRSPSNIVSAYLNADQSIAEGSYAGWDILSNGFKLRNTGISLNSSGQTYIYMAFAETPTKFSLAR